MNLSKLSEGVLRETINKCRTCRQLLSKYTRHVDDKKTKLKIKMIFNVEKDRDILVIHADRLIV